MVEGEVPVVVRGGRGGGRGNDSDGRGRGRGPPGRGRGRGKGRGGPGRGSNSEGGADGRGDGAANKGIGNSNSSSNNNNPKVANKDAKGGGAGGDKSRARNKNINNKPKDGKDPTTPWGPKLSPEELKKKEEERTQAEQAEAERKRVEAEKKALEAERKTRAKATEELNAKIKEANDYLQTLAETMAFHKENRVALAVEVLAEDRKKFEANRKTLKSDLKKCTAFVKKIKGGTAWSMKPEDILKDVATLNLTRYVEEVVAAILDAKLKVTDLTVVIALCKAMHQRYPDFLPNLLTDLWAVVTGKTPDETGKNRRIYVRIVTEFLLNGITTDTKPLVKLITEVTGGKDGNYAVTDANIVVAFAKTAGFEIFGVMPAAASCYMKLIDEEAAKVEAHQQEMADKSEAETVKDLTVVASSKLVAEGKSFSEKVNALLSERAVSEEISKDLLTQCTGAFKTLSSTLVATHGKLQKMEKRCEHDRLLSGSLTEAREQGLSDARKLRESLLRSVEVLSDILNLPMPKLKAEENEETESGGVGLELWTKSGGEDGDYGPFDDEETRFFYCDIPDFLTTVPPALLGLSQDEIDKRKAENMVKFGSGFDSVTEEGESDSVDVAASSEEQLEAAEQEENKEIEENSKETNEENKDTPHYKLMVLLEQELPECSRREQIDELAEKFCTNHGSMRNSRKRVTQTLFLVPRTRLDLLPYYSRMAATLSRVWGDISESLVKDLEQQFHGQAKYKKNQNIESRLKTARYIGELTKFRIAPPMVAFRCIRRCLDDFTGGNVDVACCVLESCGRYLYRLKHTNQKLTLLMETMIRLGRAKHLDERSQALINTAFYIVKPPASGPKKKAKVHPPLEGYLRHLLMVRLEPTESSVSFVSKQLIRLPWGDPSKQCGALLCKIIMKTCRRGRYKSIQAVASVAANLRKPEVCIRLLDSVLEELQLAMEYPIFKDQQRTLTIARLLGELYSASLASGQLIIQQLYNFLNFGHEIPPALREASQKAVEKVTLESSVPNSTGGVAQTILEDEEMEDAQLENQEEVPTEAHPVAVSKYSKYDPRVPSLLDTPNSVFRIKLVCTLFETVAKSIVTRNNLSNIEGFLAAFQRYLFTKTVLPAEVEFALLDTFDIIDSQWRKVSIDVGRSKRNSSDSHGQGFPRFKTWMEAHIATVAAEEAEALAQEKARSRIEGLVADSKSIDGDETVSSDLMNDDDDLMDDDDDSTDDALSVSAKDSLNDDHEDWQPSGDVEGPGDGEEEEEDGMDEDDDEEDDNDESDDDEGSEEEFDQEAYMQQLEDEAFERELRRLTMDALEKGKTSSRGGKVADTMPTGSHIIRKKPGETENAPAFALGGKAGISFQLLKKGNKGKMEAKQFVVPSDTNLAAVATKQDDKAAKERDMIKARVLQYEAESAEADLTGGNVYLEQEKLQVIRNRLSMDEIDRNFGTSGGNLRPNDKPKPGALPFKTPLGGRGPPTGGRLPGRGRGRGGGRNSGGRSLV